MKQVSFKERPVEARAQGDKAPYSEKIFECALENWSVKYFTTY